MFYYFIDSLARPYYPDDALAGAKRHGYSAISEVIMKGYVIDGLSAVVIAKILGKSSPAAVIPWLHKYKIQPRPRGGPRPKRPARVFLGMGRVGRKELSSMSGDEGARRFGCHRSYFYILRKKILNGGSTNA